MAAGAGARSFRARVGSSVSSQRWGHQPLTSRAGPQPEPGGEELGDSSAGSMRADPELPSDPVGLRQAERL